MYPNDLGLKEFAIVGAPRLETITLVDKVRARLLIQFFASRVSSLDIFLDWTERCAHYCKHFLHHWLCWVVQVKIHCKHHTLARQVTLDYHHEEKPAVSINHPKLDHHDRCRVINQVNIGAVGLRCLLDASTCPRLKTLILVRASRVNDRCLKVSSVCCYLLM